MGDWVLLAIEKEKMTAMTIMVDVMIYFWAYELHFLLIPMVVSVLLIGFLRKLFG